MDKVPVLVLTEHVTYNNGCESRSFESSKLINHANSSDRKWLTSHQFWAARNSRRIVLSPVDSSQTAHLREDFRREQSN